jgi:hypothetical protein
MAPARNRVGPQIRNQVVPFLTGANIEERSNGLQLVCVGDRLLIQNLTTLVGEGGDQRHAGEIVGAAQRLAVDGEGLLARDRLEFRKHLRWPHHPQPTVEDLLEREDIDLAEDVVQCVLQGV